ncbi:MAG TPA: glycosyltransferase family 4 protein [Phycisphaerae bacterium]|nr:glycosyltransferase family 4 protein [Phycisphaerae bacterium]
MPKSSAAASLVASQTATPPEIPAFNSVAKPITVCHPVWRLRNGGLERQLVQIVNRLSDERFRHVVVVAGWDEESRNLASQLNARAEVVREPATATGANWARCLAGIYRAHTIDVVHVRGLSLLIDALMAAELYGEARVACSFHGFQDVEHELHGIRRKVLREALLRCDDRWAVGPTAGREIAAALNLPRDTFGVICNGVDLQTFRPATPAERLAGKERLGLPTDKPALLCLGNIKPIKGQHVLLQALAQNTREIQEFCTVLVGENRFGGELHRWAKLHLATADVRFERQTEHPLTWYHAADAFVLPSLSEGLSNALLEAMACGLPCIATAVGGNLDAIVDRESGLLVPANNPGALARAIDELMRDAALRLQLAVAARSHVEQRVSFESMTAGYAARYQRLAAPRVPEMTAPGRPMINTKPSRFVSV